MESLILPVSKRACHFATAGAEFHDVARQSLQVFSRNTFAVTAHQPSKHWLHLRGSEIIALLANWLQRLAVVAMPGMVECRFHEAVERNGSVAGDFLANE